jgi:hypothetical protein
MRVTFPRLPDHERAWALVERDDGVVFRFYGGGTAGPRLPHDIMHLADLVACAAALGTLTLDKIRRLTADKLAALPGTEVDPVVVAVAARALQVEAARWARLRVGEELTYDWPGK